MTGTRHLIDTLRSVVGPRHVLTDAGKTRPFRRAFRAGEGSALAVVRPGSLIELWRVIQACVAADAVVITQAANTSLTGGSTPDDRTPGDVVIVSTNRLTSLRLIEENRQVLCQPGVSLHQLERILRPLGREPHSVIGSSCFGASVVGGVCNNSGGALIRRGPAYTELALFATVSIDGQLSLVNRLGVDLGEEPEAMLARLDGGDFVVRHSNAAASDGEYSSHVRDVDAATPARFNADPRRLSDASGSAGRVIVFAVRLDTFAIEMGTKTFYIGTNDPDALTILRRRMLGGSMPLPIAAEYLHRETFDVADRYGRDTFLAIRLLGTDHLPGLYALKARFDDLGERLGIAAPSERLLQGLARLLPRHLPRRLHDWRDRYAHHLILKVSPEAADDTGRLLAASFGEAAFLCSPREADAAFLHRFVAAGAAVRYRAVNRNTVGEIVALDFALPRNASVWFGDLAPDVAPSIALTLRYGHFFCHVFHHDHVVAEGHDAALVKARLLADLERAQAEYPAEHNVGRQYRAKPALADFYRRLDPRNRFNPGIGMTPTGPGWRDALKEPELS